MFDLLAQTAPSAAPSSAAPSTAAPVPPPTQTPSSAADVPGSGATNTGTSAPGTSTPKQQPPDAFMMFKNMGPIILMVVIFFFLMNRSSKKKDKGKADMLANLKKGDEVQTIGGILGKVMDAREDRVLVKVDENSNTKIWFSRTAIHRVVGADEEVK
jgi:preprotein translocase subunit YajC